MDMLFLGLVLHIKIMSVSFERITQGWSRTLLGGMTLDPLAQCAVTGVLWEKSSAQGPGNAPERSGNISIKGSCDHPQQSVSLQAIPKHASQETTKKSPFPLMEKE